MASDVVAGLTDLRDQYLSDGLHYGIATNRKSLLEILFQLGADPNTINRTSGDHPLVVASEVQNNELFELLLEHGADGETFLTTFKPTKETVRFLLNYPKLSELLTHHGANVDTKSYRWHSFLGKAIKLGKADDLQFLETLKLFLDLGPTNPGGMQAQCHMGCFYGCLEPLIETAMRQGNHKCVELILERGASIAFVADEILIFPTLVSAIEQDNLKALKMLIKQHEAAIRTRRSRCKLPRKYDWLINAAYRHASAKTLKSFLKTGKGSSDITEQYPLHVACIIEDEGLADKLISEGHLADRKDQEGRTPLLLAVKSKNLNLVNKLLSVWIKKDGRYLPYNADAVINSLLTAVAESSAEIMDAFSNARPGFFSPISKQTLLLEAIRAQNSETFNRLLEMGVDISARHTDDDGNELEPIHVAAQVGNAGMLSKLIELGANVNDVIECKGHYMYIFNRKQCPFRNSCLSMCINPDCIRLLLKHGANMHSRCRFHHRTGKPVYMDIVSTGDVDAMEAYWERYGPILESDNSIFEQACKDCRIDLVKYLLLQNPRWSSYCHMVDFYSTASSSHGTQTTQTIDTLLQLGCTFNFEYNSYASDTGKDTNNWFAVKLYQVDLFIFAKLLHERCGRSDHVDGVELLRSIVLKTDLAMVRLLRTCGHKIRRRQIRTLLENLQKNLKQSPEIIVHETFIDDIVSVFRQPLGLQDMCRIKIRSALFRVLFKSKAPSCHIDEVIQKLPLPRLIRDFLSFAGQHAFPYLRE